VAGCAANSCSPAATASLPYLGGIAAGAAFRSYIAESMDQNNSGSHSESGNYPHVEVYRFLLASPRQFIFKMMLSFSSPQALYAPSGLPLRFSS
jgi:hypothetical protein